LGSAYRAPGACSSTVTEVWAVAPAVWYVTTGLERTELS
jgi:hypothetical protein